MDSSPGLTVSEPAHFLLYWEPLNKRGFLLDHHSWPQVLALTPPPPCGCLPFFRILPSLDIYDVVDGEYFVYSIYLKVISLLKSCRTMPCEVEFFVAYVTERNRRTLWWQRWESPTAASATTITSATTTTTAPLLLRLLLETRRFPAFAFKVTNPQPVSSLSPTFSSTPYSIHPSLRPLRFPASTDFPHIVPFALTLIHTILIA